MRPRRAILPSRMRALGILRRVGGLLVVLLLLAVSAVGGALFLCLPSRQEAARIPGLSAPVSVAFDADGIPHIRAASAEDGAAALGFVHARDRMFQMELMRRAASGRMSELAGARALPFDRTMRVLGLRHQRGGRRWPRMPADTRAMLRGLFARGERLSRRAWPLDRGPVRGAWPAGAVDAGG